MPFNHCFTNSTNFLYRRESLKRKQIRNSGPRRAYKNLNALAVELDEIGIGTIVIAVILAAIVQSRTVRPERSRN